MFRKELREPQGDLIAAQKSADGIVGQAVGKAREALQGRKAEQTDRPSRNDDRRPERWGEASRPGISWVEQQIENANASHGKRPWLWRVGVKPRTPESKGIRTTDGETSNRTPGKSRRSNGGGVRSSQSRNSVAMRPEEQRWPWCGWDEPSMTPRSICGSTGQPFGLNCLREPTSRSRSGGSTCPNRRVGSGSSASLVSSTD